VAVPIVSELTCVRSSEVFYHITGDDSICGGKLIIHSLVGDISRFFSFKLRRKKRGWSMSRLVERIRRTYPEKKITDS
jgi:hypothetical protein